MMHAPWIGNGHAPDHTNLPAFLADVRACSSKGSSVRPRAG